MADLTFTVGLVLCRPLGCVSLTPPETEVFLFVGSFLNKPLHKMAKWAAASYNGVINPYKETPIYIFQAIYRGYRFHPMYKAAGCISCNC